MRAMKTNTVRRRAAGHVCLLAFSLNNTLYHALRTVTEKGPGTDALGSGLTEKELAYIKDLASKVHAQGEIMRRLGWRFLKKL